MSGPIVLLLRLLLALSLYLFLGYGLWLLWRDLSLSAVHVVERKVPAIRLEIRNAKKPMSQRAFSQPQVYLGRDPHCDVPLADPSVSARHALLSFHHGQWWLDDLGSSNGTRLNREIIQTATVLTTGDQIQCGHARILVRLPGAQSLTMGGEEEAENG